MYKHFLHIALSFTMVTTGLAQMRLHGPDSLYLHRVKTELGMNPWQAALADSIFWKAGTELQAVETELLALASSNLPEDSIQVRMINANARRKDLRTRRDMELQWILTPEQRTVFDQKLKTSKPKVLHFGVHNRAECEVCK